MRPLTISDVEFISYELARQLMSFNEPIPDFATRRENILESCLISPFQKFGGKDPYPSLINKSSMLFYLLIKNHPFQNGNKRIAVMTMLFFLADNKKWLKADSQELYNFAKWVAESNPKLKEPTVEAIEKFINLYVIDL
jgi:death-on-curing family protein